MTTYENLMMIRELTNSIELGESLEQQEKDAIMSLLYDTRRILIRVYDREQLNERLEEQNRMIKINEENESDSEEEEEEEMNRG